MKKERAQLDNKDIREKISKGLSRAKELQSTKDKEERARVPETDKFDHDNVAVDQQART